MTGLQWSHVLLDVETIKRLDEDIEERTASMEPRPIGRGNLKKIVYIIILKITASMEPRPIGRGNENRLQYPC